MAAEVFARRVGAGSPVVLMHGLFGAGGNLGALARALQQTYTVFSLDLPGHGRSRWLPQLDLSGMADAVTRWMDQEGLPCAHVLGHSLGGKVAMQLALQHPARVESLVVADIAPVAYPGQHDQVFAALHAVATARCKSRDEAAAILSRFLQEDAVIQFLLSSLERGSEGDFGWRFDLAGLRGAYPALLAAPQEGLSYRGPVLFIKGGASEYIRDRDWPAMRAFFPRASLEVMPDCGHWLHVQNPQAFNTIVLRFLAPLEQRKLAIG